MIIMGSNMAEAHPVGFQWVVEAKSRGARVIHIDPRFTRTSALADTFVPLRAGTDIAFLGGVINHVLTHDLDFREYVRAYTNAAFLVAEGFEDTEDLDGLFSGYDAETGTYGRDLWQYESAEQARTEREGGEGGGDSAMDQERTSPMGHGAAGAPLSGTTGDIAQDPTLQHPRCVFQILKRHFSRYTPEMVERICGTLPGQFREVCEAWTANSNRERTTALVYSVGWTQHSVGAQYIRAGSILQLLLGNIGRPGGGVFALRGHASIQGSTDIPTLFNLLPGYLPMPTAGSHEDLPTYLDDLRSPTQKGYWAGADAYLVSLLKEYFGDNATEGNGYGFDWLPRINGDHGTYRTVMDMVDGKVFGYFLLGQNPAVGSAHGKLQRLGMANLDWLVVRDLAMIESATFWKDSPEVETGEIVPEMCRTEVFFFPAASHVEKEGTFTQTQRMLQWREKAVEPVGDQRSELWFFYHLGRMIRERLAGSTDPRDEPVQKLDWSYAVQGGGAWPEPSAQDVLRRINGYRTDTGEPVGGYTELAADGSTACGCWIYSGVFADGVNQAARRVAHAEQGPYDAEWGWTWPSNRRVLYNRASADPEGRPWSERKKLVWWDAEQGEWTGDDVPDFPKKTPPGFVPPEDATGPDALRGDDAFIMQADGKAWLFAPHGMLDGPLPTHYEPHESPARNLLYGQQGNPTRKVYGRLDNPSNPSPPEAHREVFPFVLTAARLTEHHTAGGMSRQLPYLAELQPELFVEVSPELARIRGLSHLGYAHVVTSRAAVEARVVVTDRMAPLRIDGEVVHQVWLPYHWGGSGLVTGDVVNDLLGVVTDANVFIQESKVATCDVRPGHRPRGAALTAMLAETRARAGVTIETGTTIATAAGVPHLQHTEESS
ncbi:molybdopterin-dependent oxidoreductase [Pseudonocardia xinjiangensis]|uniref:Molybdopterin-dependent oxidoreductase n=1 Tax=Pseudonocardia xinjiangensis TaxID=75289 RepID=A0ABX1RI97_9PSEU|nr:molybdopterin-dependent oxidoreductase [Pseudonocardia xinjiangensis]